MKIKALVLAAALCAAISCSQPANIIKTKVPVRPAGQENVLGLTAAPMDSVRIGVIGLGMRGSFAVERLTFVPGAVITAVCDLLPERVEWAKNTLKNRGCQEPAGFGGEEESWKQVCEREDVDLVYIVTDWKHHTPMALYAMDCGKHVAIEVPAALTMEEIWALINKSEQTRLHCMMLENCIYDFFEMTTLAMAQSGLFGEIIHAQGAYCHNLDPFWDAYWDNWRMKYNKETRGDVYPTHGIGPICQALNIHRGDRMTSLVAMDTKAFNGNKIWENHTGEPCTDFANGDQTSTLIRTQNGKTMLIQHDVMTPRPYDRLYQLVGTDGYAAKYPIELYCLREYSNVQVDAKAISDEKIYAYGEAQRLQENYRSAILTPELEKLAKEVGGHGGMDYIMDYRLIYCLRNGLPLDQDVYDLAEWCCVAPLSALSLENGSMPVEVPDFTRGAWNQVQGFSYALAD